MNYDSDYEVRLATLEAMGGDVTKHYDSVYEIDLEILKLTEQGGGNSTAIESVDELPDASENKNKLYRLNSNDNVYVSELKSRTSTTTNRLPDEQQIDKAYLYEEGEAPYYYKGSFKVIFSDTEIDGYGWLENVETIYFILTEDNAENVQSDSIAYGFFKSEDDTIDLVNKTITTDKASTEYKFTLDSVDGTTEIPIQAIYNAPESAQIGNAYLNDAVEEYKGIYDGTQVTFIDTDGGGELTTGYKWTIDGETDYIASSKPASEIYYAKLYDAEAPYYYYITDTKIWVVSSNGEESEGSRIHVMTTDEESIYIPQLNAPDSEQVDNATIYDSGNDTTLTYTGNEVTLTASNGIFTCYLWENVEDNMILLTNTNATNTFGNTIYYLAENGDIEKIDDTHYEATDGELDSVVTSTLREDSYEISTVKYQRTEVTEVWDWQDIIPTYASDSDIDTMFDAPEPGPESPVVKRVLMKANDRGFDMTIKEGLVNVNDETMEYDGQTYYKWIKYEEQDNGESIPDEITGDDDEYIAVLTTSLNPSLPFNSSSPEWAYTIGIFKDGTGYQDEGMYNTEAHEEFPVEALIHEDGSITYEE